MNVSTFRRLGDSLSSTHPDLAKEWCVERNKDFSPEDISAASYHGAWWICPEGHPDYWMVIRRRAEKGSGCPVCRRMKENRAKKCSVLDSPLKDWVDYDKNYGIIFDLISKSSPEMLDWKCRHGHEFRRTVAHLAKTMTCPVCTQKMKDEEVAG